MTKVIIVGGGISGLALAFRLQRVVPQAEITLLEKSDRCGGTVRTEQHAGFRVEAGPNGFLDTKTATTTLCRDLGLEGQLLRASAATDRNRYLFLKGRMRRLPSGLGSFLSTDVISWRAKWALVTERFRRSRRQGQDESIDTFARRRVGAEVAEVLADAMVTGIHGGDPTLLSMPAAFPRLAELEEQHGSVMKGLVQAAKQRRAEAKAKGETYHRPGKLWSFRPGLQLLIDTLRDQLARPALLGVKVRRLAPSLEGQASWVVYGEGEDRWTADAVVLVCPAYEQTALLADLDPVLSQDLGAIPYNRVGVAALGFRPGDVGFPLDGFGYLAPQRERRDLLGVQWCSSIYPERAPPGLALMRALFGGWHRGEMLDWEDDQLLRAVRDELRLALAVTGEPVFHRIVRWHRAIPQYHLGHLERVERIEARCRQYPGLFLGGNAFRGIALNDCTEQAEVVAGEVARYLHSKG